ncbi:hypothetical protein RRU94_15845 [Domibacillus sp. DTU_2020_1001157_1_SI_ALB_TIR_016]|uniref:hypothetical protein n=1 Tax=Domibacillus sp. DTU_2020_1001157_1_SI_ALB_TIR_016 TaxID=3077789 RepID=UPI0028E5B687|nr:hypothetical protein [Domibacillus sp. DTU_2020_1001157_1_SI_ALB_TIR_016]WNS82214.1 hypothetical protein RRU94_15845 [Domibacillus sp. DTU_2020_1001157_1_SI_ALB_TIR_016]
MIPIINPDLERLSQEHYKAVREQLVLDGNFYRINGWFRRHGSKISLKTAITAPVPLLEQIVIDYRNAPPNVILKDMYNNSFSKSNKWIGLERYTSAALVENLKIKVCPYCNRNYINNVPTGKKIKRSSQLDHFFNKGDYPYLAMSFFNLIPVCPACNLLKLQQDISASPHDNRINWDKAVKFNFGIHAADFLKDENNVYVKVQVSKELEENFNVLKLDKQYEMHNDLVHELLRKGIIYSPSQLEDIMKNYAGLFHNREEMLRAIYGNYLDKESLGKRPLSKLTKDIVSRLYFN